MQLTSFDKSQSFPTTLAQLREVEKRFDDSTHLRHCTFDDIQIPVSRGGLDMVNKWQDLKCVTYDLFRLATDLLNDGDHKNHVQWHYSPEYLVATGAQVYCEMWSGNWWKRQQDALAPGAKILAFILYVDETHVTYNGRSMHPIYMSLGNLHLSFRYDW